MNSLICTIHLSRTNATTLCLLTLPVCLSGLSSCESTDMLISSSMHHRQWHWHTDRRARWTRARRCAANCGGSSTACAPTGPNSCRCAVPRPAPDISLLKFRFFFFEKCHSRFSSARPFMLPNPMEYEHNFVFETN